MSNGSKQQQSDKDTSGYFHKFDNSELEEVSQQSFSMLVSLAAESQQFYDSLLHSSVLEKFRLNEGVIDILLVQNTPKLIHKLPGSEVGFSIDGENEALNALKLFGAEFRTINIVIYLPRCPQNTISITSDYVTKYCSQASQHVRLIRRMSYFGLQYSFSFPLVTSVDFHHSQDTADTTDLNEMFPQMQELHLWYATKSLLNRTYPHLKHFELEYAADEKDLKTFFRINPQLESLKVPE